MPNVLRVDHPQPQFAILDPFGRSMGLIDPTIGQGQGQEYRDGEQPGKPGYCEYHKNVIGNGPKSYIRSLVS